MLAISFFCLAVALTVPSVHFADMARTPSETAISLGFISLQALVLVLSYLAVNA